MRALDVFVLVLLFGVLGFGVYILWLSLPADPLSYKDFSSNSYANPYSGYQFYPNMRFPSNEISFSFDSLCKQEKRRDVERAFGIISSKTVLRFNEVEKGGEIKIICSQIAPEPEEKGHFVAGEGGPTEIINTTPYSVILSGKIALYREERCDTPQIATHEIMHALGFDHSNNSESIMYPITGCDQRIDDHLVAEINRIYSVPSYPDIAIERLSGNRTGRYISFNIVVSNNGLQDVENSSIQLFNGQEFLKELALGRIDLGTRKVLTVQNVRVPRDSDAITFLVVGPENEISKQNNKADLETLS